MDFFDQIMDVPNIEKVHERGSKKWTSMMLPEHVKLIRQYTEVQKKALRPELDEFDLLVIEETIYIALKRKCNVLIKVWEDGEFKKYGGTIDNVDLHKRTITLDNPFGLNKYEIDYIVDVSAIE